MLLASKHIVTLVGSHHATGAVQAQDPAFKDELQLLPVSRSLGKRVLTRPTQHIIPLSKQAADFQFPGAAQRTM